MTVANTMAASLPGAGGRKGGGKFLARLAMAGLAIALALAAWFVITERPYKAGSDIGYYMGLVGGSMMLILLLYPLRKHMKPFQKLGALRHWFALHMALGILGPTLVIFHTAFELGSLNSKIAFLSMMLVAGSGIIGRFIYVRIHHGLYGRAATLEEQRAHLAHSEEEAKTLFAHYPEIRDHLYAFHDQALDTKISLPARIWRFMTVRLRGRALRYRLREPIRQVLARQAAELGWDRQVQDVHWRLARREVAEYVAIVCSVAQFQAWKRLFSLWHVAHIPFVFLLVGSGIAHVVAVHLY
jgi:hypothetical protein